MVVGGRVLVRLPWSELVLNTSLELSALCEKTSALAAHPAHFAPLW